MLLFWIYYCQTNNILQIGHHSYFRGLKWRLTVLGRKWAPKSAPVVARPFISEFTHNSTVDRENGCHLNEQLIRKSEGRIDELVFVLAICLVVGTGLKHSATFIREKIQISKSFNFGRSGMAPISQTNIF